MVLKCVNRNGTCYYHQGFEERLTSGLTNRAVMAEQQKEGQYPVL